MPAWRRVTVALCAAGALTACGQSSATAPEPMTDEQLCVSALALPVGGSISVLLDPARIPDLRAQALEVAEAESVSADVTAAAQLVAMKMVAVLDVTESLEAETGLGLMLEGLVALPTLAAPLDELLTAHSSLVDECSEVDGVSPSPAPQYYARSS